MDGWVGPVGPGPHTCVPEGRETDIETYGDRWIGPLGPMPCMHVRVFEKDLFACCPLSLFSFDLYIISFFFVVGLVWGGVWHRGGAQREQNAALSHARKTGPVAGCCGVGRTARI